MTGAELVTMGVNQKQYPRKLYKYRDESIDKVGNPQNSNTQKIITQNELWFSPPSQFNDPYDCNTPINTSTTLTKAKEWLNSVGIYPKFIDELADKLIQNPNLIKEQTKTAIDTFRICCFSTLDNSILQWSHYSNYHKGICFGFDLTENPDFFFNPVIVSYRSVMQHYNHFNHSKEIVKYLIQPKFHDWSYESEVRVVKDPDEIKKNGNNGAFKFKDKALCEVIFGTNTPEKLIDYYITLCMNHNKSHINFYKMELSSGTHYGLDKHKVRVINTGGIYSHVVI